MVTKHIGIEIGTASLKLAVCKDGKLLTMASARIPEGLIRDGRIAAPDTMVPFLKHLCMENNIRGGQCALVLPAGAVISQHVTLPPMSEGELQLNLPFEFQEYVGTEVDAYCYDYIVESIRDGVMNLYAAAVRRDVVEEYRSLFRKAGLRLRIATTPEMAWLNLISRNAQLPKKLAIVDVGHHSTRVSIFANGNFVMGKEIELAGQHFDEIIAGEAGVDVHTARTRKETGLEVTEAIRQCCDTLAAEVRKAVNFYNYSDSGSDRPLTELYLCGGGAGMLPLREAIADATGMALHPVQELWQEDPIPETDTPICTIAAGAAIQAR